MSQAASQAAAFYKQVAKEKRVWTIRDSGGFPTLKNASDERAQPFWSSRSRVEKIIKTVPAYSGFEPYEISWDSFVLKWVPGLTKDGLLAGINWSGVKAVGYDTEPEELKRSVETFLTLAKS